MTSPLLRRAATQRVERAAEVKRLEQRYADQLPERAAPPSRAPLFPEAKVFFSAVPAILKRAAWRPIAAVALAIALAITIFFAIQRWDLIHDGSFVLAKNRWTSEVRVCIVDAAAGKLVRVNNFRERCL